MDSQVRVPGRVGLDGQRPRGAPFKVGLELGFRELGVQGLGFRVYGLGFRELGFRV